ncbi:MAG: DUF4912 domain-containing protein [Spirochaetaceae bacterium]|jgi:hypothetical protein|nr:DUF4912 domain-containing protein [Spirochaetaceae bacterium]
MDLSDSQNRLQRFNISELVTLAKSYGIEVSPNQDRLFLIDELLEHVPCLNIYPDGKPFSAADFFGDLVRIEDTDIAAEAPPSKLPAHYNLTCIETLVRDPLWVYVFWEINGKEKKEIEKNFIFAGYALRVNLFECKKQGDLGHLFTVNVGKHDVSWYLNFPPDGPCRAVCGHRENATFQIELCALFGKDVSVLAKSEPFLLPSLLTVQAENELESLKNKFITNSGLRDLQILRNSDFSPS